MLRLTRKPGEGVVVVLADGRVVRLEVQDAFDASQKVQLAFEPTGGVSVRRGEGAKP